MRSFLAKFFVPCGISVYENESAVSWPWRSSPAANLPTFAMSRNADENARLSGSENAEYGRNEKPLSGQSRLRSTPLPL